MKKIEYENKTEAMLIPRAKKRKRPVLAFLNINSERKIENAIMDKQVLQIQDMLSNKEFDELDLVLYTRGGEMDSTIRIIETLRQSASSIIGHIPYYVYSAGTIIALACDEIVMGNHSTLSPVDPQVDLYSSKMPFMSSLDITRGVDAMKALAVETFESVYPKVKVMTGNRLNSLDEITVASNFATDLASKLAKDLSIKDYGYHSRLLQESADSVAKSLKSSKIYDPFYPEQSQSQIDKIVQRLVYSYNAHGCPISREEPEEIGIPVVEASEEDQQVFDEIADEIRHSREDIIFLYDPKTKEITYPNDEITYGSTVL